MPNLCCNDIRVSGPSDGIDAFLLAAEGVEGDETDGCPLSLERLLPTPPGLLAGDGWREWCIRNWGTKWDLFDSSLHDPSPDPRVVLPEGWREILVKCASAWSPPLMAFQSISGLFPALTFEVEYCEIGQDFAGVTVFRAGQGGGTDGPSWLGQDPESWQADYCGENDRCQEVEFRFVVTRTGSQALTSSLSKAVHEALTILM